MPIRSIKLPDRFRYMDNLEVLPARKETDGGEELQELRMTISSDDPYEWRGLWGPPFKEILGHRPGEIRLGRMNSGLAQLLDNHDVNIRLGAIKKDSAELVDGHKLRVTARVSNRQGPQETLKDVRAGLLGTTSVRYRVHKYRREKALEEIDEKTGETKMQVLRAVDWEALEASLVSVPADATVGVERALNSRAAEDGEYEVLIEEPDSPAPLNPKQEGAEERNKTMPAPIEVAPTGPTGAPEEVVNVNQLRSEAQNQGVIGERQRIAEIETIGEKFALKRELVREAITKGTSVQAFKDAVLKKLGEGDPRQAIRSEDASMGFDSKEINRFSFVKAIQACLTNNWKDAGYEKDVSEATRKRFDALGPIDKRGPHSFSIPVDMAKSMFASQIERQVGDAQERGDRAELFHLQRLVGHLLQRDLLAGSGSGASFVGTELMSADFIEVLRPLATVMQLGATVMPGLTQNLSFPRMTVGASAGYVTEGSALTEQTQTIGLLAMGPKSLGGFTEISRTLLLQSQIAEGIIRADLGSAVAEKIELASLSGPGTGGEPTGIAATSGIGDVDFGVNGAAPTYAFLLEFLTDVMNAKAYRGSLSYLVNPNTFGKLAQVSRDAGSGKFLWDIDNPASPILGHRALITTQLRNNLTKGTGSNLSEMVFGNWNELMIGFWGALEVTVNPYTLDTSGLIRITVWLSNDVGVRRVGSFSYANEVVTA